MKRYTLQLYQKPLPPPRNKQAPECIFPQVCPAPGCSNADFIVQTRNIRHEEAFDDVLLYNVRAVCSSCQAFIEFVGRLKPGDKNVVLQTASVEYDNRAADAGSYIRRIPWH